MGGALPSVRHPYQKRHQARKATAACVETLRLPSGRRGRFEFAIRRAAPSQFAGGSTGVNDQGQEEHQHEDAPKVTTMCRPVGVSAAR